MKVCLSDWLEADYIDFNGGGDGITGLAVVAGHLVVFKPQAIYVLLAMTQPTIRLLSCQLTLVWILPTHIASSEQGVYFYVGFKGLFYYNGNTVVDLFQNLKAVYPLGYINSNYSNKISVSYVNRRVWLAVPYFGLVLLLQK